MLQTHIVPSSSSLPLLQSAQSCWGVAFPLSVNANLNVVVGAWAIKIEIVPLMELKLPIDPRAVKVLDMAVNLCDLWSLLLYSWRTNDGGQNAIAAPSSAQTA